MYTWPVGFITYPASIEGIPNLADVLEVDFTALALLEQESSR